MREILFKAKCAEEPYDWVEGYLNKCEREFIISNDDGLGIFINPSTICQYTGLTDKNGNKIWENDVVIGREGYCGNPKLPTREIKFKVEYLCGHYRWLDSADMYEYEVIGNIFDNPELLKGE